MGTMTPPPIRYARSGEVAIAFFSVLLGFAGLLLAVPLAILVRMVVERALVRYRQTIYFAGAPPVSL